MGSGYNLPEGCYESDLPGNSNREMAAQRYADGIDDDAMCEWVGNNLVGDVVWDEDDKWYIEGSEGQTIGPIVNEKRAIRCFIDIREQDVIDLMITDYYEETYG